MTLAMKLFDPLKSFDRLKKSGVPAAQAREIVTIVEESVNNGMENLATKADLQQIKADMEHLVTKTDFTTAVSGIRADIAVLQSSMSMMQRLFFGGTLAIFMSLIVLYLHQ